jgi:cobalt-zinc-cadmium efflux system membrane fusion protein
MKHWLITITALALIGVLGFAYQKGWTSFLVDQFMEVSGLHHGTTAGDSPSPDASPTTRPEPPSPSLLGEGRFSVPRAQQEAIGLRDADAKPQVEPIRIELLGSTDYNPDTLTKVRPRFDALVESVAVTLGQQVKVGDPLVNLYSAQLAEAKTAYQVAKTQWEHDKRLLGSREALAKTSAISQQLLLDTQNEEIRSGLQFKVARDKLEVYGLTNEQIERLDHEEGVDKPLMTIRSPANGVVITREVVPGNIYEPSDVLLVTAPMERLWVWGNVYESDLPLVAVGQTWKVRFPYLDEVVEGRVEYVSNQVDPRTRAVRIRGSIANPGGRLKADMLVSTLLEIPPKSGRTVIPRTAMIVSDGTTFVFVRSPGSTEIFERRAIVPVQERSDEVIVGEGLTPAERVVTDGSLMLAQLLDGLSPAKAGPSTTEVARLGRTPKPIPVR